MHRTVSDAEFAGLHERLLTGVAPARRAEDLTTLARFLVERVAESDLEHVVDSIRGMGLDFYVSGESAPASASYELVRAAPGEAPLRRRAIDLTAGAPFPAPRGRRSVWRLRGSAGTG